MGFLLYLVIALMQNMGYIVVYGLFIQYKLYDYVIGINYFLYGSTIAVY